MAGGAGEVEFGPPGGRHIRGAVDCAQRIIGGNDEQRGEGEGIARHVAKIVRFRRDGVALVIGW